MSKLLALVGGQVTEQDLAAVGNLGSGTYLATFEITPAQYGHASGTYFISGVIAASLISASFTSSPEWDLDELSDHHIRVGYSSAGLVEYDISRDNGAPIGGVYRVLIQVYNP